MVRDAERRKRKYEKNVDGDQVGRAINAQKDIMVDQEKTYFPQIAEVERKVKKLCEAQGIATHLIAQYINYARECYSKAKRFTQDTLTNELQYLANKWTSRGLLGSKLQEIAKLFGVDITALPPPAVGKITFGMVAILISVNRLNFYALNDAVAKVEEINVQCRVVAGTLKNFKLTVSANSLDATTSITIRVNRINKILINVGAGETGNFDSAAEYVVSDNDLVNLRVDTRPSGVGNMTFTWSIDLE